MKKVIFRTLHYLIDLRIIILFLGLLLSIIMHELFHIVMHWDEINSISVFPDHNAIVTIFLSPSDEYDVMVEELFAYLITMITIILAIMLVGDINESRDNRSIRQLILGKNSNLRDAGKYDKNASDILARLVGLEKPSKKYRKKSK